MSTPSPLAGTIGVFDSGVGGLSVLKALHTRLPAAALHYFADSAYAPYGDRTVNEVQQRCMRITEHLLDEGARMVVVACNTATTAAIAALRLRWPEVPFVGVEPGVKPAVACTRNGRIGVMATRRTIASERLQRLLTEHAGHCSVVLQACPGLADAIEAGSLDDHAMRLLLQAHCAPLLAAGVDTVVLGCTHYPFVAEQIQALMGEAVTLIDTADAVAQRAVSVWSTLPQQSGAPTLRFETTGHPLVLQALVARWLGLQATVGTAAL